MHGSLFVGMSKQQRVAWHLATPVKQQIVLLHVQLLPIAGEVGEAPKRSRDSDSVSGVPEQKQVQTDAGEDSQQAMTLDYSSDDMLSVPMQPDRTIWVALHFDGVHKLYGSSEIEEAYMTAVTVEAKLAQA